VTWAGVRDLLHLLEVRVDMDAVDLFDLWLANEQASLHEPYGAMNAWCRNHRSRQVTRQVVGFLEKCDDLQAVVGVSAVHNFVLEDLGLVGLVGNHALAVAVAVHIVGLVAGFVGNE
jgi:hypothetical protein